MSLQAYLVDCDGENGAQIYFAKTRGQAKMQAANAEECRITEVISCKRAPELDKYAPGPVPCDVLMEMGWWFECFGCSRQVTLDGGFDYEEDEELEPVIEPKRVWCSTDCKHRFLIREARRKIEEAQAEIDAILELERRFPGATFYASPSGCDSRRYILFDLSGTTQHVQWEIGSTYVHVAPIDMPAWNRYEDSRLQYVHDWENEGGALAS